MIQMKKKNRIITEKQLVEEVGTEKQKERYFKNGHFVSNMKQTIMNRAGLKYVIEDIGDRRYKIIKEYRTPLPNCMPKLHKGLYKYIAPLILTKLINNRDEYKKVSFTFYKWARLIDMVNHNYWPMKKNIKYSDKLNIDSKTFIEYFDRVDDNLQYYIQRTLEYLSKAGVVEWFKVPMVRKRKVTTGKSQDENNKLSVDIEYETVMATPEETNFSLECMSHVMKKLKIKTKPECFFGKKSQQFADEFSKELKTQNIEYFFTTYQAYCIDSNINKCRDILSTYNISDINKFIKAFNIEFKNNIVSLAERRYNKLPDAFDDNYIDYFKQLTDITIDKDATKIGYVSKDERLDIKTLVADNIDISINGNKLNFNKIGEYDN